MSQPQMRFRVRGEGTETLEIDIYDQIGEGRWGEGVGAKQVLKTLRESPQASSIRLRVNSPGGDVIDGWAIYNLLNDHPARVEAEVDGLAASMASVILMAADHIRIAAGAMVMVHNPWTVTWGEASDLRAKADFLDKMRDGLAAAYVERTGQSREQIIDMMDAETWMSADEALTLGFADELKPMKRREQSLALAGVNLSAFDRAPGAFVAAVAAAKVVSTEDPTHVFVHRQINADASVSAQTAECGRNVKMTLDELRTQHPEAFAAAVAEGVKNERDRVCAHLELGIESGATDVAYGAIRDGSELTRTLTARYINAGMNRADRATRQAETDAVAAAVENAQPVEVEEDLQDRAVAAWLDGKGCSDA